MNEKILEAFRELGFQLEEIEGIGYSFCYEEWDFLYMYNKDDEEFLNISIPGIYELEENFPLLFHILPERINSTIKYVKAYTLENHIWLFYERELLDEKDLTQLLSKMIYHLAATLIFAHKTIKELKKEMEEGSNEASEEEENDNDEENE